jgi:hypothetical protein
MSASKNTRIAAATLPAPITAGMLGAIITMS